MGSVARWLVGAAVMLASAQAFGEASPQPPPQQAPIQVTPQPVAPPPQPKAPAPAKAAAPPAKTTTAPAKAPAKKAAAKKAPTKNAAPPAAPQNQPTAGTGSAAPLPGVGDGALSPPRPRCKVAPLKGTPIFEARYEAALGKRVVTTRLYATGTFVRIGLKEQRSSCIENDRLTAIRTALTEARWETTKSPATCTAKTAETTAIYAAGKLRFTSRECNPLVLDEKSSDALDLIGMYVGPFGLDMADELLQ